MSDFIGLAAGFFSCATVPGWFTRRLRIDLTGSGMGPDPVVCLGCWWVCQAASPRQLQLPPTHLAEAFDEFAGVLGGEFAGLVAELAEAGL